MARRGDIDSDEQEQDQGQRPADQGHEQEPDYSAEIADSIFQSMGAADDEADPDARAVGTGDKPRDDGGQPDDRTPGAAGQSGDDDGGIPADKGSQDKAAGAQKDDDPEFLKEPEGLAERSKARFQELATRYKERDTQYQELEQRYQQLEQHASAMIEEVRSTGATPEQFQRGLNYMALANKPDPSAQELQSVKQFLESELGAVNQKLGVVQGESEASQLLAAHPDLQQAVDNLEIDVKWAAQIAAQRNLHAQQQQAAQRRAYQEQQRAAQINERQLNAEQGKTAVNE